MKAKPRVLFRADGHAKIGLGHVVRSLALAEILADDFDCNFIIQNPLPGLKDQILKVCSSVIELPATSNYLNEAKEIENNILQNNDTIVLDGYSFDTSYQKLLREKNINLVCIDDIHAYHFLADIVINHSGGVNESIYSGEPYTKYYLGTSYSLLRKPFRISSDVKKHQTSSNKVFICLGGADPKNDTISVLKKCLDEHWIEKFYVVVGEAYNWKNELEEIINKHSPRIEMLSNLSAIEMANFMKACPIAITPPSTISYEYLSIGGELYLKQIAKNQSNIYSYFTSTGMAFDFNDFPNTDQSVKTKMLQLQAEHFDGQQAQRFTKMFRALNCALRKAEYSDLDLIFQWINEEETRKQSFHSEPITLEAHTQWLRNKLSDDKFYYYIAEYNGKPCGQIRFALSEGNAEISYLVASKFRGLGLGSTILDKGIEALKIEEKIEKIIGYVRKGNIASKKSFLKLQFDEQKTNQYEDSIKYVLSI